MNGQKSLPRKLWPFQKSELFWHPQACPWQPGRFDGCTAYACVVASALQAQGCSMGRTTTGRKALVQSKNSNYFDTHYQTDHIPARTSSCLIGEQSSSAILMLTARPPRVPSSPIGWPGIFETSERINFFWTSPNICDSW